MPVEGADIVIYGPVTRRRYGFSGDMRVQPVDARDAAVFLRSGLFRRA